MLGHLKLCKYRGFESYELADLARVNLLVGKNNCGKTSILEAVHFLVSKGDPSVLVQAAQRRGEISRKGEGPNISHFFLRHRFEPGACFRLSEGNYGSDSTQAGYGLVSAELVPAHVAEKQNLQFPSPFFSGETSQPLAFGLQIESTSRKKFPVLPVTKDGTLSSVDQLRFLWSEHEPNLSPVVFITPDSLNLDSMRSIWDSVLMTGRESEVIDALNILEEDLHSIHFLTGDFRRTQGSAGILLGFRGDARRVPIGSYGDGMRRLLALSLSLIQAANGFLLIDEIDTGLHWTAMADMWRLIIHTARQSSIQVFATTHSYDCIQGLAALIESEPDLASDVSVQKIETSLEEAVSLDAERIQVAVAQDIEVR